MFSTILSGAFCGVDSYLVRAEVDVAPGLPCMEMIGTLSREAREAKERIRVALKNNGIRLPASRITVNLSPADRHKSGTAFDLPVAVGLLTSMGLLEEKASEGILFLGELGLGGEIRPVRGVLSILRQAVRLGVSTFVVPEGNGREGAVIPGTAVYEASHITQILQSLKGPGDDGLAAGLRLISPDDSYVNQCGDEEAREGRGEPDQDYADICGQEAVKRALEIAAAGFHHILLIGPPGSGKTMLARRLPTIMPELSREESLEVSEIYSVAGRLKDGRLITRRPFLSPHHTVTGTALTGGGRIPAPGAASLAHRGILFLDELPEFGKNVLEVLRQPLEERRIQLARAYGTLSYPADFLLVAAMNPCPCGYYPRMERCACSSAEIRRYLSRVSGPILDRMDLLAEVAAVPVRELGNGRRRESSEEMRRRVLQARRMQRKRFQGTRLRFNGEMEQADLERLCPLSPSVERHLRRSFERMHLSMRACHKIIKTARTIADLAGEERISEGHMNEAVFYRTAAGKYWERELG